MPVTCNCQLLRLQCVPGGGLSSTQSRAFILHVEEGHSRAGEGGGRNARDGWSCRWALPDLSAESACYTQQAPHVKGPVSIVSVCSQYPHVHPAPRSFYNYSVEHCTLANC